MKKHLFVFLLSLVFLGLAQLSLQAQTVYITKTGEKYHARQGISSPATTTSQRCSALTQAGAQCKRMTKDPSGKCWQQVQ